MRRLRALFFGFSVSVMSLGAVTSTTTTAFAQAQPTKDKDKESAKKLFDEGAELEKESDYPGALARYKEAEQIAITPGLKFHKGYCLEQLGKLVAAVDEYEQADKLARAQNKAEVQAAVKARLDPLRPRIPTLTIRLVTATSDAEVQLDTVKQVDPALLKGRQQIHVDPGEHAVTAHATGYKNYVKRVQIAEGQSLAIDIVFERDPALAPPPPPPVADRSDEPPPDTTTHRSLAAPIAVTAGAVALAGAGVVFFVVAGNRKSDTTDTCSKVVTCSTGNTQTTIRAFDALALGSWIAGAALGVTAVVLWTRSGSSSSTSAQSALSVTASGSRLLLEGSF